MKILRSILWYLLVDVMLVLILSAQYLVQFFWGNVSFSTEVFQLSTPLDGATAQVLSYIYYVIFPAVIIYIVLLLVLFFIRRYDKSMKNWTLRRSINLFRVY